MLTVKRWHAASTADSTRPNVRDFLSIYCCYTITLVVAMLHGCKENWGLLLAIELLTLHARRPKWVLETEPVRNGDHCGTWNPSQKCRLCSMATISVTSSDQRHLGTASGISNADPLHLIAPWLHVGISLPMQVPIRLCLKFPHPAKKFFFFLDAPCASLYRREMCPKMGVAWKVFSGCVFGSAYFAIHFVLQAWYLSTTSWTFWMRRMEGIQNYWCMLWLSSTRWAWYTTMATKCHYHSNGNKVTAHCSESNELR